MKTILLFLAWFLLEIIRLFLFWGILICSAGLVLIYYKIYETWIDLNFILECIPYILYILSYIILVFLIDRWIIKKIHSLKSFQKIKLRSNNYY